MKRSNNLPPFLAKPNARVKIEREYAARSLREFVRQGWHVVEPSTVFVPSWHIDAICEHLEAITRGEIRNLLINVPPRHMKSLLVSVFWPAWEWIRFPERRWLYSSYAQSLKHARLGHMPPTYRVALVSGALGSRFFTYQ
jgi:hypothetical protein